MEWIKQNKTESIRPKTTKYVKWKNILGLVALIVIVFIVITVASLVGSFMKGNCVEKEYLKACFSMDKSTLAKHQVSTITIEVTNIGETAANATVALKLSPNLANASATTQQIGLMNPEDTVKKEFKVASKDEVGKFKIEVDINKDGIAEKALFLTVEQK